MARKASSKPASSTATIGFEADSAAFGIRHSDCFMAFAIFGRRCRSLQVPGCLWGIAKLLFVRKCRAGAKFELALAA